MHWIRSYFNYRRQTKKLYWTGVSAFQDISRFWLLPFLTTFPQSSGRVKETLLLWWTPQVTKSEGGLPEGRSTGENIFRLPKGYLRSQEGRFHGVIPRPQDSGNWCPFQTKGYQFLPTEETQGQSANPENAHGVFGTFGGRGCWWWWKPGEWWPWQNWRSYRRVYGTLGKGCKRCPSRWETLLSL